MIDLRGRHFLTLRDYSKDEILYLIEKAQEFKRLKKEHIVHDYLKGRNIVMIFEKTSTRTRCSFEVAAHDLGMGTTYLDPRSSQMGRKESLLDTAKVLGRMYDAIEYRGFRQDKAELLAKNAGIPVLNGLTGSYHPTQMLADMLTIKDGPVRIFPADTRGTPFESKMAERGLVEGHKFYGHGFYEGASIRKIGDIYYFIYSSVNNHELCYATSRFPDRDFTYRGVIVSNGDVGYAGRRENDRLNHTGTTHGSIECINGRWYVFYHRQTHGSDYSRQACAEPIVILPDGRIPQVEITSCGLNGAPLAGEGTYPAVICCNLTDGHMPHGGNASFTDIPMITHDKDERFLAGLKQGTQIVYKYFDLSDATCVYLMLRGKGRIASGSSWTDVDSANWKEYVLPLRDRSARQALRFQVLQGELEMLSLRFEKR